MSCNVDSANFVEELPLRELQTRKPVKWERPFVFSALERPETPTDNNEENQNQTLCTVAEDASFNSQLSLNHSAHHGSINLCEEEAADHLPDENKPWNHPCHFPPKRYASLKSEVEPETLIQMISEEQEQFNGLERYCDPKTRYYSSFNEIKTTELIDRRSSSPEPNDFEENAQCSWDHSMDKNGVHTLQVDQKSSELGISVGSVPPDRSAFKIANNAISTNLDFEQILDSGTLDCQADFHSAGAEQAFVDSLDHEQKIMHFQYGAVRSSTRKPTIFKEKKYAESDDDEYIPEYKYSSVPKSSKKKIGRPRKNAL